MRFDSALELEVKGVVAGELQSPDGRPDRFAGVPREIAVSGELIFATYL
jgi:hypothetical protein